MTSIAEIQPIVQEYAETIAEVLEADVAIVDDNCVRVGGAGPHFHSIGRPAPERSFLKSIIRTGQPGIVTCTKKEGAFSRELTALGLPIYNKNTPVGAIGIMALTEEQKGKVFSASPKILSFLKHMVSLMEGKLMLVETNKHLRRQVRETMEAGCPGPGLRCGEKATGLSLNEWMAEYEKNILSGLLRPGSSTKEKTRVARQLKISLATLYRKLDKYKLI